MNPATHLPEGQTAICNQKAEETGCLVWSFNLVRMILDLESSPTSGMAATITAYCPGGVVDHPKPKISQHKSNADDTIPFCPCTLVLLRLEG